MRNWTVSLFFILFIYGCGDKSDETAGRPPPVPSGESGAGRLHKDAPFLHPVEIKTEEDALKRYHQWLTYLTEKVGVLADEKRKVRIKYFGTNILGEEEPTVEIEGPIDIELVLKDGSLSWVTAKKSIELDRERCKGKQKVEPEMTKEEVIETAQRLLRLLIHPDKVKELHLNRNYHLSTYTEWVTFPIEGPIVRVPSLGVHFGSERKEAERYLGAWRIGWSRVYKGFLFESGGVLMCISDEHGLRFFSIGCWAPYPPTTEVRIWEGKAIELARKTALSVWQADDDFFKIGYSDMKLGDVALAYLLIVHPNHIFDEGHDMLDFSDVDDEPRLAWNITFYVRPKDDPSTSIRYYMGRTITVYVDAATGEILGGGFGF